MSENIKEQVEKARAVKAVVEAKRAQAKFEAEQGDVAQNLNDGFLPAQVCQKIFDAPAYFFTHNAMPFRHSPSGKVFDAKKVFENILERKIGEAKTNTVKTEIEAALIRRNNAQAEAAEIKAKIFRREYVSAEQVERVWLDVATILRQGILTAGKKLLSKIDRAKNENDKIEKYREWAEKILEGLKVDAARYLEKFTVDDLDSDPVEADDRDGVGDRESISDHE